MHGKTASGTARAASSGAIPGKFSGGLIVLSAIAGLLTTLWESRILIGAAGMFSILVLGGGVLFLVSWRVTRRFGWAGQVVMLLLAPIGFAVRDRIWWQHSMKMMVATPGIGRVLGDAAFFAVGLVLSHLVMRLIGAPAEKDLLARTR